MDQATDVGRVRRGVRATAASRRRTWCGRIARATSATRRWRSRRCGRNWSGLVPVPGDGRYEWNGYLPINALPHVVNPEKGYIATANNYLFPPDYPLQGSAALHRRRSVPRLADQRGARVGPAPHGRRHDAAAERQRLACPRAASCRCCATRRSPTRPTPVDKARRLLLAWNFSVDADSVAAGIYEMWQRRVSRQHPQSDGAEGSADVHRPAEHEARHRLAARARRPIRRAIAVEGRDELLARSLDEAVAELTKKLGPDMNAWRWGQTAYHHALIRHPLGDIAPADVRAKLNVGPYPARRRQLHGQRDRQRRQPDLRRVAQDHRGHRELGQLGRPEQPRPVRRSRRARTTATCSRSGRAASTFRSSTAGRRSNRSRRIARR